MSEIVVQVAFAMYDTEWRQNDLNLNLLYTSINIREPHVSELIFLHIVMNCFCI